MKYYDLLVSTDDKKTLELAEHLGWTGVCVTCDYRSDESLREFAETARKIKSKLEILAGALITGDTQKNARNALSHADLVATRGGSDKINRETSECWEIDLLVNPEPASGKDFMDQKDSGLDHVMAHFMGERGIAYCVDFNSIIGVEGRSRVQLLGRMRQNIMLARKYNVPIILVSGAKNMWGLRSPRELAAVGMFLGLTKNEAYDAISKNPQKLIQKSRDRKNPNIITRGLEVTDWGEQKPNKEKKMYGWY